MALAGPPDAVLLLGARLGMFTGGRQSIIPAEAKVIQVDIEGEEIGRGREIDVGIVADCRETLRSLIREAQGRTLPRRDEWVAKLRQTQAAIGGMFADALNPDRRPIHPWFRARCPSLSSGLPLLTPGRSSGTTATQVPSIPIEGSPQKKPRV